MKRLLCFALCLAVSLMVIPSSVWMVSAATVTYTTSHAREVLSVVTGETVLSQATAAFADLDGNGRASSGDTRRILMAIVGNQSALEAPQALVPTAFRLSSITDTTDSSASRTYSVTAPYTDTYELTGTSVSSMSIAYNGTTLGSGTSKLSVALTAGKTYTLTVKTSYANRSFSVTTKALNHLVTLPYDILEPMDTSHLSTAYTNANPLKAAKVNYQKRHGGTYIYSNNPEQLPSSAVGKTLMCNEDLTGDVYFTFEHSNKTTSSLYLGYRVTNTGSSDVFITVTNIGMQTDGSWLGNKAWCDFYNTAFQIADNYYDDPNNASQYGFSAYTPRVYQPMTYRLPAGKSMYVIGGTTTGSYNYYNVGSTAGMALGTNDCANGTVKFQVTGGKVTGRFHVYRYESQVSTTQTPLGYVTDSEYSNMYSGSDKHAGVIDNRMTWSFNDQIGSGMLPVKFTTRYDKNVPTQTTAYAAYNSQDYEVTKDQWTTHLNPQNSVNHDVVGTDMVEFHCTDDNGNQVVIDNDHADGNGNVPNTGNWMIEYQDHYTFVNRGNKDRTISINMRDNGSLAMLVRNSQGEGWTPPSPSARIRWNSTTPTPSRSRRTASSRSRWTTSCLPTARAVSAT